VQTGVLPGGGAFVPSEVAIHSEGRTIAGNGTRSASTSVSLEGWGTRHVSAQATAQAESLLVISQRHYPGWSATIDGRPAPVRRVDGVLMAVELPPGAHRVELTFAPRGFLWWCAIAAVAALIVLGFALAGRWRRAR